VPNITLYKPKGIWAWGPDDIVTFMSDGFLSDGNYVGGAMTEVFEKSTGRMTEEDLRAIATFLSSTSKHQAPDRVHNMFQ